VTYRSPLADLRFILSDVVPMAALPDDPGAEVTEAVLTGAARLSDEVLAPLDRAGDTHPARLENGTVRTSPGFAEGYRAIAEGGWVALAAPAAHGGAGLPEMLQTAVNDMMAGACISLQLNPLLTQGQIAALSVHAPDEIRALFLPRLISGEWYGTMNLTEPQAGSDVGALTTRAEPAADGTWRITGRKVFITWGDSDVAANVCHLVLARVPGGGPGTRGSGLFLVPKFLPDGEGRPGARNSLHVERLEQKFGLHGSPTCAMSFEGAAGFLVGEPTGGMAAMFTMMNAARLAVGVQGTGVAEAALQKAVHYASVRVQGEPVIGFADVRRMLATARAEIFAARALNLTCAQAIDLGGQTGDPAWAARAAFLTPIVKTFGTETGLRVCETAMQVFGGMGYVEETGIAQHYRDVRVTTIYEGTNGIQAMDLVGRKLADGGAAALALVEEVKGMAAAARGQVGAEALSVLANEVEAATRWMVVQAQRDRQAGGIPYLLAFARMLGGGCHLRAAMSPAADGGRRALASLYLNRILPRARADLTEARAGAADLDAVPDGHLLG
jgi:alkylation response protein AidB-like acyl-CoA dehydrogenase